LARVYQETVADESVSFQTGSEYTKYFRLGDSLKIEATPEHPDNGLCNPTGPTISLEHLENYVFGKTRKFLRAYDRIDNVVYLFDDSSMDLIMVKFQIDPTKGRQIISNYKSVPTGLFGITIHNELEANYNVMKRTDNILQVAVLDKLIYFNVINPENPTYLTHYILPTNITKPIDTVECRGYTFVADSTTGVAIFDTRDIENIKFLKMINNDIFTDESGLLIYGLEVNCEKSLLYILDNSLGLFVLDITNIDNIQLRDFPFRDEGGFLIEAKEDSLLMNGYEGDGTHFFIEQQAKITFESGYWYPQFTHIRNETGLSDIKYMGIEKRYGILLMENIFIIFKRGVSESVIPDFEHISTKTVGVNVQMVIPISIPQSESTTSLVKNSVDDGNLHFILIFTDTKILVAKIVETPPGLHCNSDLDSISVGKYTYKVIITTQDCKSKEATGDHDITNYCQISFKATIQITPENSGFSKGVMIGIAVALPVTVVAVAACIHYYNKTKQYQKLIEYSQTQNSPSSRAVHPEKTRSKPNLQIDIPVTPKNDPDQVIKLEDLKISNLELSEEEEPNE